MAATTAVLTPSPIQALGNLVLPAVQRWGEGLEVRRDAKQRRLGNKPQFTRTSITTYEELVADHHRDVVRFKRALDSWMKEYKFRDEWIATAAIQTLLLYYPETPEDWSVDFQPWPTRRPIMPMERETMEQFRVRGYAEVDAWVKERRESSGSAKGKSEEHAIWTAHRFAGRTYPEIVDIATKRDWKAERGWKVRGPDAIQYAVERFAKRAGLTLP